MHRSKLPYFFLALAALLAISALALLFMRPKGPKWTGPSPAAETQENPAEATPPMPAPVPGLSDLPAPENPAQILQNLGVGVAAVDPAELVNQIAKAMEAGDLAAVAKLIGKDALDSSTLERLKALTVSQPLKLRQPGGVREVGELELNALARWSLELDGPEAGRDRIFLDLRRKEGKWFVEKLTLPPPADQATPTTMLADSLGIADTFVQAVLRQDFEFARGFVDSATVSDAKIAGLCIMFEEGGYRLRPSKPLRAMFQRQDVVG